jgi:hypothetical protein
MENIITIDDCEIKIIDENIFEMILQDSIGDAYLKGTDSDQLLEIILHKITPIYFDESTNIVSISGSRSSIKAFLTMIGNAFNKLGANKVH